jgi:TRAP transporter 4TM/12TM fusion protein
MDSTKPNSQRPKESSSNAQGNAEHPAAVSSTQAETHVVDGDTTRWATWAIAAIALSWSVFQLSLASFLVLNTLAIRAIHLGFAFLIAFLAYPALKSGGRGLLRYLSRKKGPGPAAVVLAGAACFCAVYIVIDYEGISLRQGLPVTRDLIVGIALIVFLLEASRRVVGPALPVIAIVFILYALFGNHLPDFLAFRGVSLSRLIGQLTLSSEGIYGIPLDVSANIVFLFVLFGAILEKAGAGQYFIKLALCLLGRFKGGPAKAAILASGLTGMVSGSSIANIVTTGTFTIPLMKKVGYPPRKAAAVEVAASTDGQLAPPIMGAAAFIIAEYVNVTYLDVVRAALVPALVSYIALMYITHVEASKLGIEGMSRDEIPLFRDIIVEGLHFLIPIGVLVVELVYYRHSPQMSVFRAIVVLTIIILIELPIKAYLNGTSMLGALRDAGRILVSSLVSGGKNMVSVAIATACAGIIVGVVTLGLGGLITEVIDVLSHGNLYLMLFITAVACLIIGMGLPTTATYIVMASLTAPALVTIGEAQGLVVPLIAAHLFCFYFGILADDTPPVGLASYTAAAIARSEPIPTGLQGFAYDIRTAILPFMFIFNHELLLIGVESLPHALLVIVTASVGAMAFVSATQGWYVTKNRWYEIPLLLLVTFVMLRPDLIQDWGGFNTRYPAYAAGIVIVAGIGLLQRRRIG